MSSAVRIVPVSESTWKLAERFLSKTHTPEMILSSTFAKAIAQLEHFFIKFEPEKKDRVWKAISQDKLPILRNTFIKAFCVYILNEFKSDEIDAMLEEHRESDSIKSLKHRQHIMESYQFNKYIIVETVFNEAKSMTDGIVHELLVG